MTLLILCALAPIGAIDVLYYHLYRFRLFERDHSVAEELTHLVRHVCFVALVALLASGVGGWADRVILVLLVVDLINSAADVLLEPRSRAPLGGLPAGEYFLHFLGRSGRRWPRRATSSSVRASRSSRQRASSRGRASPSSPRAWRCSVSRPASSCGRGCGRMGARGASRRAEPYDAEARAEATTARPFRCTAP
jgi:hypothetical protein